MTPQKSPVLNFFRAWTEAWKEITNIVGDAAAAVMVAKSEGELSLLKHKIFI